MATSMQSIPKAEGAFDAWEQHFVRSVTEHPEVYQIGEERTARLGELLRQWETESAAALAARDQAKAATRRKDEAKAALLHESRTAVRMIQGNPDITDAQRADAGVHVAKQSRTPVPVPSTFPVGFVMASDRLEHTLSFSDSASPTRRARPLGVTACEIYVCVADETPQDPGAYRLKRLATRTPEQVKFSASDAGRLANYLLRWVNTKGETCPWSQIISATIPAV